MWRSISLTVLAVSTAHAEDQRGIASVFNDRRLACPPYRQDHRRLEIAHRTLPCGTRVRITLRSGRNVVAVVVDRGPYRHGRIVDLVPRTAAALGLAAESLTPVSLAVLP